MHQRAERHGEACVHVRLLSGHKAEVLDAGQADVLDDEVQPGEVGRGNVHVLDVEGVFG